MHKSRHNEGAQNIATKDIIDTYKDDLNQSYVCGGTKLLAWLHILVALPNLQMDDFLPQLGLRLVTLLFG
jgi:hypothetical protein